jgi:hypothetical protein
MENLGLALYCFALSGPSDYRSNGKLAIKAALGLEGGTPASDLTENKKGGGISLS